VLVGDRVGDSGAGMVDLSQVETETMGREIRNQIQVCVVGVSSLVSGFVDIAGLERIC